ncbi:MFS family permease [Deinococcus metalli]|uniref:MFS family permease n=1 Tax=Deinococcus metalli TaxID=1141878 RepID=A0A7W8KHD1_9DEIO|nr:MFS transporter [Deinococcus metalli]MBB5377940.1 MFS family permease [Deinococcus metalli]GHF54978.1 MFS transporter [Deinococcus metalli]
MTLRDRLRLPLAPGTLPGVLAAAAALACSEFVRSGLYGAYLQQAAPGLLNLPKKEAVAVAATAFTVHFISDTVMRPVTGTLIGRYGGRPVVLAGAAVSLLAMAVLATATHSIWLLLLVAALHGAGFSAMWPTLMNLTAEAAHESHQGRTLTAVSMTVLPAIGLGVLLLGALGGRPFGQVAALIVVVQALSLVAALFVPGRTRTTAAAPTARPVRARLGVAARALAPLIPAAFMQTLTMTLLGPLLFTLYPELHLDYWQMVAVLGFGAAVAFGSMPFTGRVADRGRARLAVMLGFALLAAGLGGIATLPPLWALFPLAALVAVGYAFIAPGWSALVVSRLPERERPAAWGALMIFENVGTSLGPIAGAFAYRQLGTAGPFATGAVLALITALGYLIFRRAFTRPIETGPVERPADAPLES